MKKTITKVLLLLPFLIYGVGEAIAQNQQYEKVLKTDSTSWISYHRELEYCMKDLAWVKSINDTNYLYFSFDVDKKFDPFLVGTLKEEDGRLWITYMGKPHAKILIMDMNLEVGDEFVFDEHNNISATVTEIRHENGHKIIVFDRTVYHWYQEPLLFIEGIGRNIMGFLQFDDYDKSYQTCKFDRHVLAFSTSNPHFENCELLNTSIDDFTDHNALDIYPNPVKDLFTIDLNNSKESYVINIFNSNGVLVKTAQSSSNKTTISSEQMVNGLYLIEIIYHNQILHKKLLINK